MQKIEVEITYKERSFNSLKMTVLIVDDSPLIITKIKELLEEVRAVSSVKTCGSYASAVLEIANSHPKIAVLDINLPDRSGIELLLYLKAHAPETTVIMFTNQGSDYYRNLCLKMGADHFLDKSKDFDHIPLILSSLIEYSGNIRP